MDCEITIGIDNFEFDFSHVYRISAKTLKNIFKRTDTVSGYFTPPNTIGLYEKSDTKIKLSEDMWSMVLSHEVLHQVLYELGYDKCLDELNCCSTFDLDNSGLGKKVGYHK